jgi:hypothetical protein
MIPTSVMIASMNSGSVISKAKFSALAFLGANQYLFIFNISSGLLSSIFTSSILDFRSSVVRGAATKNGTLYKLEIAANVNVPILFIT